MESRPHKYFFQNPCLPFPSSSFPYKEKNSHTFSVSLVAKRLPTVDLNPCLATGLQLHLFQFSSEDFLDIYQFWLERLEAGLVARYLPRVYGLCLKEAKEVL